MTVIFLYANSFTGQSWPTKFGACSQVVGALHDSTRAKVRNLPTGWFKLSALEVLAVSENSRNSSFPTEFGRLTALSLAGVYYTNSSTGALPIQLKMITTTLHGFLASNNWFSGMPTPLGQCRIEATIRYMVLYQ